MAPVTITVWPAKLWVGHGGVTSNCEYIHVPRNLAKSGLISNSGGVFGCVAYAMMLWGSRNVEMTGVGGVFERMYVSTKAERLTRRLRRASTKFTVNIQLGQETVLYIPKYTCISVLCGDGAAHHWPLVDA